MLSLQLAERSAGLGEGEADLVLHLIASHHGHARPFAPVVEDREPPPVLGYHAGAAIALEAAERALLPQPHALASGVADRFWRLTRRYGWWGLAYLEAVLRLGDWYGSAVAADDPPQDPPPLASGARIKVVPAPATQSDPLVLTGLDGANPLGFLAALGTLAVLSQGACPQARLAWKRTGAIWRPVISDAAIRDKDRLCSTVFMLLRDSVENDKVTSAWKELEAASATLEAKELETRKLPKEHRKKVLDALKDQRDERLYEWARTLRPELSIRSLTKCDEVEFQECIKSIPMDRANAVRGSLDYLAAFSSDSCVEDDKKAKKRWVVPTPFCFTRGSGHQFFLDTVRELLSNASRERLGAALFEPWTYSDEKLSMRWDPVEDRRYALMDRDPTASDNKSRTVWMANLLAYRALSLFPSAPGRWGLKTAGWSGEVSS
jgi:hypothetical protein